MPTGKNLDTKNVHKSQTSADDKHPLYLRFINRNSLTCSKTDQVILTPIGAVTAAVTCTAYILCWNNIIHCDSLIDQLMASPTQNKFETKVLWLILKHIRTSNIWCKWHPMTTTGEFFTLPQSLLPYISIEKPILVCNITYKTQYTTATQQQAITYSQLLEAVLSLHKSSYKQ